jgi:hypothetical protein
MLYKLGLLNRPELNKVLLSLIYSWVEGRGKDREFKISLYIGGLYLPLGGLSLPLHLEAVATFGSHYFP